MKEKKQKVEIIITGARNRDPATFSIIKDTISKLHQQGIKTVFCPAIECSITSESYIKSLEEAIVYIQKSIDKNYKQFFSSREDLKLPFFTLKDQSALTQYMEKIYPSASKPYIDMALQSIITNESNKQNLLLLKLIKELNIPYKGMDDLGSVPAINTATEHKRVFEMAKHIIGGGLEALEGANGVIICDVCNMYAPKLTAMLQIFMLCKEVIDLARSNSDMTVQIDSIFAHSPYVEDEIKFSKKLLTQISRADPQYLQNWYKEHPIKDMLFAENSETGQFHSEEFSTLVGEAIKFVEGGI